MYRRVLARSLQLAASAAHRTAPSAVRSFSSVPRANSIAFRSGYAVRPLGARAYSAPAGLSKDEVEGRIMDILKNFDKVQDPTKLNSSTHFANDLGLDSLDTVEVVMAIEEEFSIEIPDKEADKIHSIDQAVGYIVSQPDAH